MFLTASNLAHYLIGRGLVSADSIVDGDFAVVEASRRNRNFKVARNDGSGLFIKQVSSTSADAVVPLQREAVFYSIVRRHSSLNDVAKRIPRIVDYDPTRAALAVELIGHSENLTEYHSRVRVFPEHIAAELGSVLAQCHSAVNALAVEPIDASLLPHRIPWILTLDPHSLAPLSAMGTTGPQLAHLLQQLPIVRQGLSALASEWRFDSLIHGDIKWDNILIFRGAVGRPELRIVDWELVDYGDGCWDVASILTSYLMYWILTLPLQPSPAPTVATFAVDLSTMRPAMKAFVKTYCERRGFAGDAALRYEEKCLRCCAGRMVSAIFEYSQGMPQLSPNLLFALQLVQNVFLEPRRAARDLVGL